MMEGLLRRPRHKICGAALLQRIGSRPRVRDRRAARAGDAPHPAHNLRSPRTAREYQNFGRDYDTPDGTAVRDYVHVTDLASAHLKALEKLTSDGKNLKLNLGTGSGYSVLEVIKSVERLSGRKVPAQDAPRRAGDPPVLVADSAARAANTRLAAEPLVDRRNSRNSDALARKELRKKNRMCVFSTSVHAHSVLLYICRKFS